MQGVILLPTSRSAGPDIFWLDHDLAMYHSNWDNVWGNPWQPVTIVADPLGGSFNTPPAAVSVGLDRLDVFGLGANYDILHKVYDASSSSWSPDWENLGGNLTSTPVAASTAGNRIDLFGIGFDQGMLHRAWDGSNWSDWEELGGGFTSLPVVLPAGSGGFEIFARGLDYMVYHMSWMPNVAGDWELLGGALLGAPAAASAPAAIRTRDSIFVFVTGADGAIWYIRFDGKVWKPWSSIGYAQKAISGQRNPVSFVSEPVVTAPSDFTGSEHIVDVFGVGSPDPGGDRALWHGWLDSTGWHGQTDPDGNETGDWKWVGGSFACAPSIVAGYPSSFKVVEPNFDGTIHLLASDDGSVWDRWPWVPLEYGPKFRLPSSYRFSVDSVEVRDTRALHEDTDHATATLAVGRWPVQQASDELHDVNKGLGTLRIELYDGLSFPFVVVELCEPVAFAYSIVNSGNQDIAKAVVAGILKAGADRLTDFIKSQINPPSTVTALLAAPSASGGLTADVLTDVGGGIAGGIIGGIVGAALTVAINQLLAIVFASCDGVVASNLIPYQKGRDLQAAIQSDPLHKIAVATQFRGSDSPAVCNPANSDYTVYWSISPTR